MITQQRDEILCRNNTMQLHLGLKSGISCLELQHLAQGHPVSYDYQTGELFRFYSSRGEFGSADFKIEHVNILSDETEELASIDAYCAPLSLQVRLTIILQKSGSINVLLQSASSEDYPQELRLCCPFLKHLTIYGEGHKHYPGNPLYRPHPLFHYPYVIVDAEDCFGYSVAFPSLSDLTPAVQNRNVDLWSISSQSALEAHKLPLRLGKQLSDTLELELTALEHGWREAFEAYRVAQRQQFDLTEHHNPHLQWLRQTLLHHFTYLYSKESYDYKQGKVDIAHLLDDGKSFGGYDTITLWHQYPRLGVDERNQWDFYDDFPGGREGLQAVVQQAHEQDVRVFLPYKPWDIGEEQSVRGTSQQVVQLIENTDIDGLFLDTMSSVPAAFRPAIDQVKNGVAFCAEVHPTTRDAVNGITSSWGKSKAVDPIPMLDYLRFLLPEHPVPIISRWATDEGKDRLIERAIFSATGLVIWQDVFGTWLPYSDKQKARIRAYKKVWQQNRTAFGSMHPIPLYPSMEESVLCNCFPADDGTSTIFTFCNMGKQTYTGPLVRLPNEAARVTSLFDEQATLQNDVLYGEVSPKYVTALRVDWVREVN